MGKTKEKLTMKIMKHCISIFLYFSLCYNVKSRDRIRTRRRGRFRDRTAKDDEKLSIKMLVVPYSQVFVGTDKLNKFDTIQVLGFETLMREIASREAPSSVSIESSVTNQNRIPSFTNSVLI